MSSISCNEYGYDLSVASLLPQKNLVTIIKNEGLIIVLSTVGSNAFYQIFMAHM